MKKNLCTYIPLNWFYYQKITKLKSGFTECRLVSRSATTEDTNSFEPLFVLICCRCTVFFSFHSSPKKGSGKKGGKGGICKRCMKDCVLREASRRSRSRSRHLCFWFSPHPFIQTLLFVCLNKYLVLVNSPTRAHLHLSFYPPLPSLPPSLPLSLSLSLSLSKRPINILWLFCWISEKTHTYHLSFCVHLTIAFAFLILLTAFSSLMGFWTSSCPMPDGPWTSSWRYGPISFLYFLSYGPF